MIVWTQSLVDGYVHALKFPSSKPRPVCGQVLNSEEGANFGRADDSTVTCPGCLEKLHAD